MLNNANLVPKEDEKVVDFDAPLEGSSPDEEKQPREKRLTKKRSHKAHDEAWLKLGYKKPNYAEDREKELRLRNLAIKGVTQLFNAVSERQNLIDDKLAEMKKAKNRSKRVELLDELKSNDFHSALQKMETPAEAKDEQA